MPNIQNYDITIDDGTTTLGLMYAPPGREGRPALVIQDIPPLPPRSPTGRASYTDKPPVVDLVWALDDWSGGYGQYAYDAARPNRYAWATGWETRWPGVLTMGAATSNTAVEVTTQPANAGFETGTLGQTPTSWSAVGVGATATKDDAQFYAGAFSCKIVSGANPGSAEQTIAITNVIGSPSITVSAYVYATGTDQGGVSLNATNGSTVTPNSVWTQATVAATPTAGNNTVKCRSSANTTVWYDSVLVTYTGVTKVVKLIVFNSTLYLITNRTLHKWSGTAWTTILLTDVDITDAEIYSVSNTDYLFLARGGSAYLYMTTGEVFTTSTLAGNGKLATYLRRVGQTLWKTVLNETLHSSTDPLNTSGSWSTAYTVGTNDKAITGLFTLDNLPVAGKKEGLFTWDATNSVFKDSAPDFASVPDAANFDAGFNYRGNLYLGVRGGRVLRWDGSDLVELLEFIAAPQFIDFGGKVYNFASDGGTLYYTQDSPTANTSWLMGFRENLSPEGTALIRAAHTMRRFTNVDYARLAYFSDALWMAGFVSAGNILASSLALPTTHQSMALDTSPNLVTSSELVTPWWDGAFPDTSKAFLSVASHGTGLDADKTIAVAFQLDSAADSGAWTTLGTIDANSDTLYFSAVAAASRNGKRIRFRLTGASNVTTAGPQLYSFVLHSTLRPTLVKQYTARCIIPQGAVMGRGVEFITTKGVVDSLRSLKATVNPLTFKYKHRLDGANYSDTVHILDVQELYSGDLSGETPLVVQLTLAQVVTS